MTLLSLQQAILAWLFYDRASLKSERSIEGVGMNLYRQLNQSDLSDGKLRAKVRNSVIDPMLRLGVIEFYGNGLYGISPSSVLMSSVRTLVCNIPSESMTFDYPVYWDSNLGLKVFNSSDLLEIAKKLNLRCNRFDLGLLLKKFLPLKRIITQWADIDILDTGGFLILSHGAGWRLAGDQRRPGIYKMSDMPYADRLLRMSRSSWKKIPSRISNPNAFFLAMIFVRMEMDNFPAVYLTNQQRLIMGDVILPGVLERLLTLNTLLNSSVTYKPMQNEYFISRAHLDLLNSIFDSKISIQ